MNCCIPEFLLLFRTADPFSPEFQHQVSTVIVVKRSDSALQARFVVFLELLCYYHQAAPFALLMLFPIYNKQATNMININI